MLDLNSYLVVIFSTGETTTTLSEYCFNRLGFTNVIMLNNEMGFYEKFIAFADIAHYSEYTTFIRSDSDRLVFDGIKELIELYEDSNIDNAEGWGFDFLLNKFRAATPQIYSKASLSLLHENNQLISDVQKPENYFCTNAKLRSESFRCFTNLHDFNQRPSKICNSAINRLYRDGYTHFDLSYIDSLPLPYKQAFKTADEYVKRNAFKTTMKHEQFDMLDVIDKYTISDLNQAYSYYANYYRKLHENFYK
jgi:hypothetical protein